MSALDPLVVRAELTVAPRDPEGVPRSEAALAAWIASAFEAPCVVVAARIDGGTVRATLALSTAQVAPADQRVLSRARTDQALWRSWVEQCCAGGWCTVTADVRVATS